MATPTAADGDLEMLCKVLQTFVDEVQRMVPDINIQRICDSITPPRALKAPTRLTKSAPQYRIATENAAGIISTGVKFPAWEAYHNLGMKTTVAALYALSADLLKFVTKWKWGTNVLVVLAVLAAWWKDWCDRRLSRRFLASRGHMPDVSQTIGMMITAFNTIFTLLMTHNEIFTDSYWQPVASLGMASFPGTAELMWFFQPGKVGGLLPQDYDADPIIPLVLYEIGKLVINLGWFDEPDSVLRAIRDSIQPQGRARAIGGGAAASSAGTAATAVATGTLCWKTGSAIQGYNAGPLGLPDGWDPREPNVITDPASNTKTALRAGHGLANFGGLVVDKHQTLQVLRRLVQRLNTANRQELQRGVVEPITKESVNGFEVNEQWDSVKGYTIRSRTRHTDISEFIQ